MKTTFCRTVTEDNLRLDGLLFEPDEKLTKVILHLHGMAGNFYENEFLDAMAKEYTESGYAFLTGNNRGHDMMADFKMPGKTEKFKRIGEAFEKIEESVFDVAAWLKLLQEKGYKELILQGHSLGAVKAAYFLSQRPKNPFKALVLASPPDMLGQVRVKTEKKNFLKDLKLAKKLVAENKGDDLLDHKIWDWYIISAKTYLNIFADGSAADVFPILRGGDFKELENIKIPILAFYGGTDDAVVFSPKEDLAVIKKHLKNPKSKTLLIGTAPHSYFKYEKEAAQTVVDWLEEINL